MLGNCIVNAVGYMLFYYDQFFFIDWTSYVLSAICLFIVRLAMIKKSIKSKIVGQKLKFKTER